MAKLQIVRGSATDPKPLDEKAIVFIPHIVNDMNAFGSGFVVGLIEAYGATIKEAYHKWYRDKDKDFNEYETREFMNSLPLKIRETGLVIVEMQEKFALGNYQLVKPISNTQLAISNRIYVYNMIAQHQITGCSKDGRPPIRYGALAKCMEKLVRIIDFYRKDTLNAQVCEIHAPPFGSERAGGSWEVIKQMIEEIWIDNGIDTVIYDYSGNLV